MSAKQNSAAGDGWYYQWAGETIGPVAPSELKQAAEDGKIIRETLIKRGAQGKWVPATHVKGLPLTSHQHAAPPPIRKTEAPSRLPEGEQNGLQTKRPRRVVVIFAAVAAVVVSLAVVIGIAVAVMRMGGSEDLNGISKTDTHKQERTKTSAHTEKKTAKAPRSASSQKVPFERLSEEDRQLARERIPPKIRHYLEEMEAAQKEQIAVNEKELAELEEDLTIITNGIAKIARGPNYPARAADLTELRDAEKVGRQKSELLRSELQRLRARPPHIELHRQNMRIGKIGVLEYGVGSYRVRALVEQVSGPKEMYVRQVLFVDGENKGSGNRLLVRGVSIKGIADNTMVPMPQVFEVVDTHTYTTVEGGTNTVFIIEPIDLGPYVPKDNRQKAEEHKRSADQAEDRIDE